MRMHYLESRVNNVVEPTLSQTNSQAEQTLNEKEDEVREGSQERTKYGRDTRMVTTTPKWTLQELREEQLKDSTIGPMVRAKEDSDTRPSLEMISTDSAPSKTYWAQWEQLKIRQGVLCRRYESDDGKLCKWQVILPTNFMEGCHGGTS